MKLITPMILSFALIFISSCNKDEPKFSPSEIQNALSELKGSYQGEMEVSYYQGNTITNGYECNVVSSDSLTINMDLTPIASVIPDEDIASRLREIGVVRVKAGYDFLQMDDSLYHFVLLPDDVICLDGNGTPTTIRIVFSQSFGGDADFLSHYIIFNLSPIELWVGDKKYKPFRQLVYHYEGTRLL